MNWAEADVEAATSGSGVATWGTVGSWTGAETGEEG